MAKDYTLNPKKDKRGLTPQEAVFADNILEVGKEAAAALAYPLATPESQRVIAAQKMEKPEVLSSISRLANAKGLTKDACLGAITEGLSAVKKTWNKQGDEIEYDDTPSRLKAAELGLKVHGELKNTEASGTVPITKDLFIELCQTFWGTKPQ